MRGSRAAVRGLIWAAAPCLLDICRVAPPRCLVVVVVVVVVALALLLLIIALRRPCLVFCLWPLQHRRAETIAVHEGKAGDASEAGQAGWTSIFARSAKFILCVYVRRKIKLRRQRVGRSSMTERGRK